MNSGPRPAPLWPGVAFLLPLLILMCVTGVVGDTSDSDAPPVRLIGGSIFYTVVYTAVGAAALYTCFFFVR